MRYRYRSAWYQCAARGRLDTARGRVTQRRRPLCRIVSRLECVCVCCLLSLPVGILRRRDRSQRGLGRYIFSREKGEETGATATYAVYTCSTLRASGSHAGMMAVDEGPELRVSVLCNLTCCPDQPLQLYSSVRTLCYCTLVCRHTRAGKASISHFIQPWQKPANALFLPSLATLHSTLHYRNP